MLVASVIQVFERQQFAFERPILRVGVEPHRLGPGNRQPNVIAERMTRDPLPGNLRKARVNLWRHLDRAVRLGLGLGGFIWIISFVALIAAVVVLIIFIARVFGVAVGVQ